MEFVGEPRQAMRARLVSSRYFPNPLGIVPLYHPKRMFFVGMPRQAMRARLVGNRYFPNPLGIAPAV